MQELYRGTFLLPDLEDKTESSFSFGNDSLAKALVNIYEKTFRPMTDIERNLFYETFRLFNQAAEVGFKRAQKAGVRRPDDDFVQAVKYNNAVFSAFRVHRMQNDMAALLLDENGQLQSFGKWVQAVQPIADHFNRSWLRTEYQTAVLRAHQAANWAQFERYKQILPNVEWVKTTSPNPGEDHRPYWGVILPVEHPLWLKHRPGDRWNCKCNTRATDKPAIAPPPGWEGILDPPHDGLENNPVKDKKLFSDSHPYIKNGYPGAKRAVAKFLKREHREILMRIDPQSGLEVEKSGRYYVIPGYEKRLKASTKADKTELEDNINTAKTLLDSFPKMKLAINEHVIGEGIKNPEYTINGQIADAKRIHSEKGVSAAFKSAIAQGCTSVVLDLDKQMGHKPLSISQLAKYIAWRMVDFETGVIRKCYVVYRGKAVVITSAKIKREQIRQVLEKLKP